MDEEQTESRAAAQESSILRAIMQAQAQPLLDAGSAGALISASQMVNELLTLRERDPEQYRRQVLSDPWAQAVDAQVRQMRQRRVDDRDDSTARAFIALDMHARSQRYALRDRLGFRHDHNPMGGIAPARWIDDDAQPVAPPVPRPTTAPAESGWTPVEADPWAPKKPVPYRQKARAQDRKACWSGPQDQVCPRCGKPFYGQAAVSVDGPGRPVYTVHGLCLEAGDQVQPRPDGAE